MSEIGDNKVPQGEPQALNLKAPEPVRAVSPSQALGLVPVSSKVMTELETKVDGFVADLVAQDVNSPEFGKRVDAITALGAKEIRDASSQGNRFLDRPTRSMDKDSGVSADLIHLRRVVEQLDPSRRGGLQGRKKLFGLIPFGTKARDYFDSYKSSQTHISTILTSLAKGKDELLMDNAAVEQERVTLWTAMGRLEQMIQLTKTMDSRLEDKAHELDDLEPQKAKAIRETALFYTRQRHQDLLTQMAVTVQGYLALDQVKKNNVELVKGVDRASTTTVAALRTAVTVAQALTSQKLVLDSITNLNETTSGIIDSTSRLLKDNTARIHEQASSSSVPVETLQRAFQNVYDTMDAIDDFKLKALESMKTTVNALGDQVDRSRGYIARAEGQEQGRLAPSKEVLGITE